MSLKDEMSKKGQGKYLKKMQGTEMQFQLKDLEATEEYKVWDDASKQFFKTGQGMTMTATDGTVLSIEDTKFIKNDVWAKYFPNHAKARTSTVNRNIIREDGEGQYNFPITANKALQAHIDTIKNTGGDPLKVLFLLKKTDGTPVKYDVSVLGIGHIQIKQPLNTPNLTLKPVSSIQITLPTKAPLNEQERALVEAYKGMPKEHQTAQNFVELYKQNKEALGIISDERLTLIFDGL